MTTAKTHDVKSGDVVSVTGRHVGDPGRTGEIVEVLGDGLEPHYRVRWDDGHESIFYPGEGTSFHRPKGR